MCIVSYETVHDLCYTVLVFECHDEGPVLAAPVAKAAKSLQLCKVRFLRTAAKQEHVQLVTEGIPTLSIQPLTCSTEYPRP